MNATQSLRDSTILLITYVAIVELPVPVTAKEMSIASAFLNKSQPVVICDTPTLPSVPPDKENVRLAVVVLNAELFATEPHAVPEPKLAEAGCANQ